MATNPNGLIAQLLSGEAINGFQQNYQAGQDRQLWRAGAEQQLQAGAAQLQQAQVAQQRAGQFQQELATYQNDPSAQNLSRLALRFPEYAKPLKESKDILDADAKQAQTTQLGAIFNLADNAKAPELATHIGRLIEAEKRAGIDTADAQDVLDGLNSTDPEVQASALKSAKAFSRVQLAALGAKGFEIDPNAAGDSYTLTPGSKRFDSNNRVVAEVAAAPQAPIEVPIYDADGHRIGTQLVSKGGDPASGGSGGGGSAPAGRTQGGWTPRARNGGDNTDEAVDNKIAGMSRALGVDPTADISTLSPMKIAQALSLSEGGDGSLADRNNNPTNLRNGDGSYQRFASKDAAMAKAAALVARKLKNGQTTIQTLVEGLPVGGKAQGQAGYFGPVGGSKAAADIRPNDITSVPPQMRAAVQAITDGRSAPPRPGTRNGEALLDAVTAYDPTFDAANAQSRVKTRVDFTSGKSAQNITAMNTAMGHLLHLDDQAHDLGNSSFLPGVINPIYNYARDKAGNTSLGAFEQTKQAAASELRKVFAGASGGNLEELRQFEANLSSSKSYEQLHSVIRNGVELLGSRLNALQDQYAQGMGRSDKTPNFIKPSIARQAAARFGVDLGGGKAPEQSARPAPPAVGAIQKGYRFNGGDPSKPSSWTKL